jgi:two-component system chemotaxis sensor kinase CheA
VKTRTLLVVVFGVLLVLVVGRAVWSYASFTGLLAEYNALLVEEDRADRAAGRVATIAVDMETGVRGWLVTRDREFLDPYDAAQRDAPQAMTELEQADGPDRELVAKLRGQLDEWSRTVGEPLADPGVFGRPDAELVRVNRDGKVKMDAIRATIGAIRASLASRRAASAGILDGYRSRTLDGTISLALVLAAFLVGAGLLTVRVVERPLGRLTAFAERAAKGELGSIDAGGVHEVRTLGTAMSDMSRKLAEERERDRQFTALVSALSAGGNVATIAAASLRRLMADHGAAGGVLWVADDDRTPLRLGASHGFDVTSLPAQGDAAARDVRASGEALTLDDLSADGPHVMRTALVDAVPRSLLVAPVVAGSQTVGVLELAGTLPAARRDDLRRSLERIGVALQNAVATERVGSLSREVNASNERLQAQNEELRAQEEELRAQGEELVAQQGQLVERNAELARASRMKSDFLSSMSHELRTPLNAVIGFADVLLSGTYGPVAPEQRAAVTDIHAAGRQLLTLVNDILDLSKIEAGRLEVRPERVDLAHPAVEACSLLESLAARKGVSLDDTIPAGALFCVADGDRVRQVIVNLLSNAVKFTPRGGKVTLSARVERDRVRVEVADTGVGIAATDASLLFQPFSQVDRGAAAGGTGLGLSICKRLIELMGGEIGFTSEPGRGSVFFFTLPVASGAGAPLRPPAPEPARHLEHAARGTVVVVEDEPTDARVTEEVLAGGGYQVRAVRTGEEALDLLETVKPEVVVVDLGLPGMSGFALVQRVREKLDGAVAIVVLTARDLTTDERTRLDASVDLVAQKGMMTGGGFLDAIGSLRGRTKRDRVTGGGRVLVVDDSEVNRRVVKAVLSPAGYDVVEAPDAAAGLAIAREQPPRIVLMDIRMPGMDGLEATRELAADPRTRGIPVVAVSAQAMAGDRDRALAAGCVAYVAKPIGRQELLDVVSAAIRRHPSPLPAGAAATAAAAAAQETT